MRACGNCGLPGVAGADLCLGCGEKLVTGRRAASPFAVLGFGPRRRRLVMAAGVALVLIAGLAFWWVTTPAPRHSPSRQPSVIALGPLAVTRAPPIARLVHLAIPDVQYSCVGVHFPGDRPLHNRLPAVIDSDPMTSWHCDGDGASTSPPMSVAVFFPRALTLTQVGVIGYDPARPCRFVTRMAIRVGRISYQLNLPASAYPRMIWFAVPHVRAGQVTLVVLRTTVTPGRTGPGCTRTSIAEVGFAT